MGQPSAIVVAVADVCRFNVGCRLFGAAGAPDGSTTFRCGNEPVMIVY
jgi:hypothetical protein